jgi:hypothetical protein
MIMFLIAFQYMLILFSLGQDIPVEYNRCLDENCAQVQRLVLKPKRKAEFKNLLHSDYNFYKAKLFGEWKINMDTLLLTDYDGVTSQFKIIRSHDLSFLVPLTSVEKWGTIEKEFFDHLLQDPTYLEITKADDLTTAQRSIGKKRLIEELWLSSSNTHSKRIYVQKME